jgi:hypothetical protein
MAGSLKLFINRFQIVFIGIGLSIECSCGAAVQPQSGRSRDGAPSAGDVVERQAVSRTGPTRERIGRTSAASRVE